MVTATLDVGRPEMNSKLCTVKRGDMTYKENIFSKNVIISNHRGKMTFKQYSRI